MSEELKAALALAEAGPYEFSDDPEEWRALAIALDKYLPGDEDLMPGAARIIAAAYRDAMEGRKP